MNHPRLRRLLLPAVACLAAGALVSLALAAALAATTDPFLGSLTSAAAYTPENETRWSVSRWDRAGATCAVSTREAGNPYGVVQACGPADTPLGKDLSTAWASQNPDAPGEWLELTFANAVVPAKVRVHENFNAGAVARVTVFTADGTEVEAWRRKDPPPQQVRGGIANITLSVAPPAPFPTNRVKLYLDTAAVPDWNEIDAVELVDAAGNAQWAAGAAASSAWNQPAPNSGTSSTPPPAWLVPNYGALDRPGEALTRLATKRETRCVVGYGWPMAVLYGEADVSPTAAAVVAAALPPGPRLLVGGSPTRTTGRRAAVSLVPAGAPAGAPGGGLPLTAATPPAIGPGAVGAAAPAPLPKARRIHWAGLAVNALLFATLLAAGRLLVRAPGRFVREVSRLRDGRCIGCGYDLGYDFAGGCPECGWRRSGGAARAGSPVAPPRAADDARAA